MAERNQREKRRDEEAKAAAAERDATDHQRRMEDLHAANSPADLLRCIAAGDERLPVDLCVRAWVTVVEAGLLTPSAELVNVEGRSWRLGANTWFEASRSPAWNVEGAKCIDAAGNCWFLHRRPEHFSPGAGGGSGLEVGTYLVPTGHPYLTEIGE